MSKDLTEQEIRGVQEAVQRKHILSDEQREIADRAMSLAVANVNEWATPRKTLKDEFAMSVAGGLVSGGFFALLLQQELATGKSMESSSAEACKGAAGVAYKFSSAMLEARKL